MTKKDRIHCTMIDCNNIRAFSIKVLVQHPTCKRWQTWKVCVDHKQLIIHDRDHPDNPRFNWTVRYRPKKDLFYYRPVIEIGDCFPYSIPVL